MKSKRIIFITVFTITLFAIWVFSTYVYAQQPEVYGDYNPGEISAEQIQQLNEMNKFIEETLKQGNAESPDNPAVGGLWSIHQEQQDFYKKMNEEYEKQQEAKKKKEPAEEPTDSKMPASAPAPLPAPPATPPRPPVYSPPPPQPSGPTQAQPAPQNTSRQVAPANRPAAEQSLSVEPELPATPNIATEEKIKLLRLDADKKFGVKITSNVQDTNNDGSSDEMEVLLGLDPTKPQVGDFSEVEKKLYGIDLIGDEKELEERCAIGTQNGAQFSTGGFTILAACPAGGRYTLYLTDDKGVKIAIATKQSSDNGKIVFMVDGKLTVGRYKLQIAPASSTEVSFLQTAKAASSVSNIQASRVVEVLLAESTQLAEPDVKKVEDQLISDLKDGKISVSGMADAGAAIIGSFESAVFTSALLADVKDGQFRVVSAKPLGVGNHSVVVYASDLDLKNQSRPVKVDFEIVEEEKDFPVGRFIGFGSIGIFLLLAVFVLLKKRKT